MTTKLFFRAIFKIALGIILLCLLIFLPAGEFYFNGQVLMIILFVPMFIAGVVMMFTNTELLKRRLNAKEKQKEQALVVKLSALMFITGFVVSGLDYRFSWSHLPKGIIITAVIIFLVSYLLYAEVIRENTYLSRTIEVQQNQKVIDTGLYSVVRHPMYFATVFLFLAMPVILGSVYGFLIFLIYPFIIAKRIKSEETFLENNLDGYIDYKKKVRYRLIPFIW